MALRDLVVASTDDDDVAALLPSTLASSSPTRFSAGLSSTTLFSLAALWLAACDDPEAEVGSASPWRQSRTSRRKCKEISTRGSRLSARSLRGRTQRQCKSERHENEQTAEAE